MGPAEIILGLLIVVVLIGAIFAGVYLALAASRRRRPDQR